MVFSGVGSVALLRCGVNDQMLRKTVSWRNNLARKIITQTPTPHATIVRAIMLRQPTHHTHDYYYGHGVGYALPWWDGVDQGEMHARQSPACEAGLAGWGYVVGWGVVLSVLPGQKHDRIVPKKLVTLQRPWGDYLHPFRLFTNGRDVLPAIPRLVYG